MRRFVLLVLLAAGVLLANPVAAGAHTQSQVGDLALSLGWREEPTYAGLPNAVTLSAVDGAGRPVVDPDAGMTVTIVFGDASVVRPLVYREPGVYRADVVPTQAGTYAFHVTGSLAGQDVDIAADCSDATFHCVAAADEVEFPPQHAVGGELIASSGDGGDDSDAITVGVVALALSAVALVVSGVTVVRSRRTGRSA
jgi:hypothetical protein